MDFSMNAALRQVVLSLIQALLTPLAAMTNPKAEAAAKANGTAFVEAGGVQLLVDMLAGRFKSFVCLDRLQNLCCKRDAQLLSI